MHSDGYEENIIQPRGAQAWKQASPQDDGNVSLCENGAFL